MPSLRSLVGAILTSAVATGLTATLAVTPATSSPSASSSPSGSPAAQGDILEAVQNLPGVTSVIEATAPAGYRFFKLTFRQPVDHRDPEAGTFEQRLTLLHKDAARPMVMYTSGYNVSSNPSRSEPTQIVDGNQLSMEYRFFSTSIPAQPNWSEQLTIWQAASDQHRIIKAFKRLYRENWLTTGGSKGGMTATYHRRFFPDDVDGTVPYVAPNDVDNEDDSYNEFLANVGTDPQCRTDLTAVQRRILGPDRAWFLERTRQDAEATGDTWDVLGSLDRGMEIAVIDLYFTFWQYSPQSACAAVPQADATKEEVWDWTLGVVPLTGYLDQGLLGTLPYYYQAAYQLGWYEAYEEPLADVLQHPGGWGGANFVPAELKPIDFDRRAMADIDRWVRTRSTEMLYVYGGNDPWGAEAFDCGRRAAQRACSVHVVEGGTHGARIAQLPEAERVSATAQIRAWAGLDAAGARPQRHPSLDRAPDYLRPPGR
ncbi:S28 family serine protease [Nocardioides sp. WS12]|uniref:S28 family serine protease n=1 Tax=Nocardioides sp. WS12 TaxID=2486272 RepID=UPI0015F7C6E4|nr:S28 family serine protease [Nocardioides sp. WS12]